MSNQPNKPIQQGATSAAANTVNDEPPSPIRKASNSKQSPGNEARTPFKPFLENVEKKGATDNPEGDTEDKGGTRSLSIPVQVEEANAPSALVAGSNGWSPEMGIEKFRFSHCREWRMSEFVAPTWSLSPVIAPGTFQKHSIPFPRE